MTRFGLKLLGPALFLAAISLYLYTACPVVYVGDSGELISAAYTLGIPHPPGYPLFCLLGKLLSFLPAGTIAFRVNLLAVIFASLTALVVYKSFLFQIKGKENSFYGAAAFLTAAVFSVTFKLWSQSGMAKGALYCMALYFVAGALYSLLRWSKEKKSKSLYLAMFLGGLAIVSHQTALVFIPAAAVFAGIVIKRDKTPLKAIFISFIFLISGFLLYLYLPLRAAAYPEINCGNPVTLSGMLDHIMRKQYGALGKNPYSFELFFLQLKSTWAMVLKQFPLALLLLSFTGLAGYRRERKELFWFSVVMLFSVFFGLMLGTRFDITVPMLETAGIFFLPGFLIIGLWVYSGITWLNEKVEQKYFRYFVLLLMFVSAIFLFRQNYPFCNKQNNRLGLQYGIDTLNSCRGRAAIFVSEDSPMYQMVYLKVVEKAKPDVEICDETGTALRTMLTREDRGIVYKNELAARVSDYYKKAKQDRNVYYTLESGLNLEPGTVVLPSGMLYYAAKKNEKYNGFFWKGKIPPNENKDLDIYNRDMLARYRMMFAEDRFISGDTQGFAVEMKIAEKIGFDMDWVRNEMAGIFGRKGMKKEWLAGLENAARLFRYSVERRNNLGNAYLSEGRTEDAIKEYEAATAIDRGSSAALHNLGNAYMSAGKREEAERAYIRAAELGQTESFSALSQFYMSAGQYEKAVKILTRIASANPSNMDVFNSLALSFDKLGRQEDALKLYAQMIAARPDYIYSYINCGNIYYSKGSFADAGKMYSGAISANPAYPEGYFNLGLVYLRQGNKAEARRLFEKTLSLDGTHTKARTALGMAN
ncbi:MAG: DUF2723 domain-containing protein [Candidatus Firestonebacteria bacterium]